MSRKQPNPITIDREAGVIKIHLKDGRTVLADLAMLPDLNGRSWHLGSRGRYPATTVRINGRTRELYLHQLVCSSRPGQVIDHLDGDTLNCLRSNLRACSQAENLANRKGANRNSQTGLLGVTKRADGRYEAKIRRGGRRVFLGTFSNPQLAAEAYRDASLKMAPQKIIGELPDLPSGRADDDQRYVL